VIRVRKRHIAVLAAVATVCFAGGALAAHVQVDPATVPTGFLTAHSTINNVPTSVIARALRSGRTDLFLEHGRLDPGESTGYQTTPGPVFVVVQKGTLSFRDAAGGRCRSKSLTVNQGVTTRTGRVHALVAGAQGADYYAIYLLPRRTGPHRTAAATPAGC
jgi:hypothetical protein